jgi:2-hydroxy-6-oxonona-2,4-dienedioate hydrolase
MAHEASFAIQSRRTQITGGTIHYLEVSAGGRELPVVILVHGFVVASTYMVPTAEQLSPFCRVYVPDLPGYTDSPEAEWGFEATLAEDLLGFR